jgi:L-amino acid N-acyltransferase YncA
MEIQLVGKSYPKTVKLKDKSEMLMRLMKKDDITTMVEYFSRIPAEDRLYQRVNMFDKKSLVEYWDTRILEEKSLTLLGYVGDELVGVVSLHQATAPDSAHVAYIRLSVSALHRSKGVASILSKEIFSSALILKVDKVCAEVVRGQDVAQIIFQKKMGFKKEAIRKNHIKDNEGKYRDLIIFSNNTKALLKEIKRRTIFASIAYGQEY